MDPAKISLNQEQIAKFISLFFARVFTPRVKITSDMRIYAMQYFERLFIETFYNNGQWMHLLILIRESDKENHWITYGNISSIIEHLANEFVNNYEIVGEDSEHRNFLNEYLLVQKMLVESLRTSLSTVDPVFTSWSFHETSDHFEPRVFDSLHSFANSKVFTTAGRHAVSYLLGSTGDSISDRDDHL